VKFRTTERWCDRYSPAIEASWPGVPKHSTKPRSIGRNQPPVVRGSSHTPELGGVRPAARHLKIKRSYLSALLDGTKKNPGDWYLRKLGLRRVTYIEEI